MLYKVWGSHVQVLRFNHEEIRVLTDNGNARTWLSGLSLSSFPPEKTRGRDCDQSVVFVDSLAISRTACACVMYLVAPRHDSLNEPILLVSSFNTLQSIHPFRQWFGPSVFTFSPHPLPHWIRGTLCSHTEMTWKKKMFFVSLKFSTPWAIPLLLLPIHHHHYYHRRP